MANDRLLGWLFCLQNVNVYGPIIYFCGQVEYDLYCIVKCLCGDRGPSVTCATPLHRFVGLLYSRVEDLRVIWIFCQSVKIVKENTNPAANDGRPM